MVVAVLLELLCFCAVIFVALIRWQVSYLSSLILRLFVLTLCVRVTFLIHLKDKHTPESIDAHSFNTIVSILDNILTLPTCLPFLFGLQVLRLLSSLLENLYRLNWNISLAHGTANTRRVPTLLFGFPKLHLAEGAQLCLVLKFV